MKTQNEYSEEPAELFEEFTHQFKSYVNTLYELYLFKTVQKISSGVSTILVLVIVTVLTLFLLAFASIGTALWLNELLENSFYGFFIVAGFYALLVLVIYALRKKGIRRSIQNTIVSELLND